MWRQALFIVLMALIILLGVSGCATLPPTQTQRDALLTDSQFVLQRMLDRDKDLAPLIDNAAGYAIFPGIGKGGLLVAGAFGRGTVYDREGTLVGYSRITQASVGGVIGGRTYAMLVIFESDADLEQFTEGSALTFGAEATAVAINDGASATSSFINGVAVFAMPRSGLMADASLNGQAFEFEAAPDAELLAAAIPTN